MQDTSSAVAVSRTDPAQPQYEAIIIGAGVCGIYQMYRLQELGINATVLEAGGDVGGTWYWNRYPGARFDSESITYGYSFSKELLQEWNWSERFAAQPETERYLRHVVEKFGLRKYMQFNCRVDKAVYDEKTHSWQVHTSDGRTLTTRFLLTAVGLLSAPTLPRYEGQKDFKGLSFHTYFWPREPVDFKNKRVGVIGTGATAVQLIAEIADKVGDMTVFQRRPNWCAPLRNGPIDEKEMAEIKTSYDEIFATCRRTPGGFIHEPDPRDTFEVSEAERLAFWEKLYDSPGFGIWLANFKDTLMDEKANAELTAFIASKIRQRVKDQKTAEKLIPKDHGFGMRRVPLETYYYEAYNRDNVHLVDLIEQPIERITEKGVRTTKGEYEFDIVVYATGFDAITGSFDRIDFVGKNGQHLRDKWADGPLTTFGMMSAGFPNLITIAGPQSGSVSTNFPRGIEEAVDWTTGLLQFMRAKGLTEIDPKQKTEDDWVAHVKRMYDRVLLGKKIGSWVTGYNSNLDRDTKNRFPIYVGGALRYRGKMDEQVATGYEGFDLSSKS